MTKRSIRNRLDQLEAGGTERDGFHYFEAGPHADPDKSGFYTWNSSKDVYENSNGHTLPAKAAPDSEFEYTIESENGNQT